MFIKIQIKVCIFLDESILNSIYSLNLNQSKSTHYQ